MPTAPTSITVSAGCHSTTGRSAKWVTCLLVITMVPPIVCFSDHSPHPQLHLHHREKGLWPDPQAAATRSSPVAPRQDRPFLQARDADDQENGAAPPRK